MPHFSFSIQILLSLSIHYTASSSDFDYCSITCGGKEHTMCKYPKDGGPKCADVHRGLTKDEKEFIVHIHNELREMVALGKEQVTAANMMSLVWCKEAENIAQRWADQCTVLDDHLDDCRTNQNNERGGQIVAFTEKMKQHDTYNFIRETVTKWFHSNESYFKPESVDSYKFDPKTFAYTQIVWARTDRVGCGLSKGMVEEDTPSHRFVCNYYPAGNIAGEPVFIVGKPCTKCPFAKCSEKWKGLCQQESATIWNRDPADTASRDIDRTYDIVILASIITTLLFT